MTCGGDLSTFSSSKSTAVLYIPIPFWFCRDISQAFPVRALQHRSMRLNLAIEKAQRLIIYGPQKKRRVAESFCYLTPV
jgi:hypothetical protein